MILVCNAGSSSLKVAIFDADLQEVAGGSVTEIGGPGELRCGPDRHAVSAPDHATALDLLLDALQGDGIALRDLTVAGHRVVHGGERLTAPARLTPDTIAAIEACIPLAPLHNPANLAGITALRVRLPKLPQTASFDTAFHATNPAVASRYAIPQHWHDAGIRRYGFHGLSYAGLCAHFGADLPPRLLALHLGNGASLCAIQDGKSVAASMGYSPVSGLTMGTRSGEIDAAAVLRIAAEIGVPDTDRLLNKASGLLALGGTSNMKTLLDSDDPAAAFAVDHFCYWAARHAGSAIVAMGGVDAIAFTGGIGENAAAIRDRITAHLAFLGDLPVHVVPADEERQIARDALSLIGAE